MLELLRRLFGAVPALPKIEASHGGVAFGGNNVNSPINIIGLDEEGVRGVLREELSRIATAHGIPEEPLRNILEKMGEKGVPHDQIVARLDAKAEELVTLRGELARLRDDQPEFAVLWAEALALLDKGELDAARAILQRGRVALREKRKELARSEARFLVGEARIDRLQLDYDTARAKFAEAVELDPEPFAPWAELGDLWLVKGSLAEAEKAFGAAEIAARRSGDKQALLVAHSRLGTLKMKQGDLDSALRRFQASAEIAAGLAAAGPEDTDRRRSLMVSHLSIGDVHMAQGDLDAALDNFCDAGLVLAKMIDAGRNDPERWRELAAIYTRIGRVLLALDDPQEALLVFGKALEIVEPIAGVLSGSADWQHALSLGHKMMGDAYSQLKDVAEALASFRKARPAAEGLIALDPGNVEWQRELANIDIGIGDGQLTQGDADAARKSFAAALERWKHLASIERDNAEWQNGLAVALERAGDALMALGDREGALRCFDQSAAITHELVKRDKSNAELKRGLLVGLVKISEADPAAARRTLNLARNVGQSMAKLGQLAPRDEWMIEELDRRIAALPPEA